MEKEKIYQIFEINYNQFAGGIFRYIYFKVSEYEIARDITSDTFVRYWKVVSEGKNIENHRAFLYFIAKGLVIDYYRKKKNNKQVSIDSIDERLLGIVDTIDDTISQRQEVEQIYLKIKKLKKGFQDVLFLHYVEDLTVKEISFIQNKNENAIRVLLHRALKTLKENL